MNAPQSRPSALPASTQHLRSSIYSFLNTWVDACRGPGLRSGARENKSSAASSRGKESGRGGRSLQGHEGPVARVVQDREVPVLWAHQGTPDEVRGVGGGRLH